MASLHEFPSLPKYPLWRVRILGRRLRIGLRAAYDRSILFQAIVAAVPIGALAYALLWLVLAL